MLRRQVDPGEAEAIALAADLKADIVITDEQEGRGLARQVGLSIRELSESCCGPSTVA